MRVMVISRLPNVACVMKGALMNNLFLGAGARLARYIGNDSARGMILHASKDLARGSQVLQPLDHSDAIRMRPIEMVED